MKLNLFKKRLEKDIKKEKNIFSPTISIKDKIIKIISILKILKENIEYIDVGAKNLNSDNSELINFWDRESSTFNTYIDKTYSLIYAICKDDFKLNQLILKQFKNLSLPLIYNEKRVEIKLNLVNNIILSLNNYLIELSKQEKTKK